MGAVLGVVTMIVVLFVVDFFLWGSTPCEGECQNGATYKVFTIAGFVGLFASPFLGMGLGALLTKQGKDLPETEATDGPAADT